MNDRYMSPEAAALRLARSVGTIRRWIRERKLRAAYVMGRLVIEADEVERMAKPVERLM